MTEQEVDKMCHSMEIEEISKLRKHLDWYISKWFGFDPRAREARTAEWIVEASKRLEGKVEPCCECGNPYPAVDLHFGHQIYCSECRKIWGRDD